MRLVTAEEMRELDRRAIEEHGIPGPALMRRAGLGVAESVRRLARASGVADFPVVIAAGPGNNGGDGFAAALYLLEWGFSVKVRIAAPRSHISGDARNFLDMLPAEALEDWCGEGDWDSDSPEFFPRGSIFVDALLGTGAAGEPRGGIGAAVRWFMRAKAVGRIVAVDLPSGLDSESGESCEAHVAADITVCLALPKRGLLSRSALRACGRVEIAPIGFPAVLRGGSESGGSGWIAEEELRGIVVERRRDSHKGDYGGVLVVGGARGYSGAPVLAVAAAVRSGAGLVSALVPGSVAGGVAARVPDAMVWPCGDERRGFLGPDCADERVRALVGGARALVVGPGLSMQPGVREFVELLLADAECPAILDADALNAFAGRVGELRRYGPERMVLTPHPGEAGRLLGCGAAEVQADRPGSLKALVDKTGCVVVLKGAGTLVGAPGRGAHTLLAGNPGMATGGSGDVLAGVIGGLLAQGMAPFDAARLGVWCHATAGDLAAWRKGEASLAASDLLAYLGEAYGLLV